MITPSELLDVVLAPVIVATIIAGIGRWRYWSWTAPLAAGAGFMTGYALLFVPKLPPTDGTDWLFWLAIPATLLGMLGAIIRTRWCWILGMAAGGMLVVIALPLIPHAMPRSTLWIALPIGVLGMLSSAVALLSHPRVPANAIAAGLCVIVGGAAVVVMSSNIRSLGVYGIAASAALGPVAILIGNRHAAGGVMVVAFCLLTGLLTAGVYYADPGVTRLNVAVLIASPVLLMTGLLVPGKRDWVRGVVSVLAVVIAVSAITVPTALHAMKAAEATSDDPYSAYYAQ